MELLAASPALEQLTSFGLRDNNRVGPEGVRRLTAAPWLAGLRELNLSDCYLGAAGVEALADCPTLAALERARSWATNLLTAAAMQALASSRHLTRLRGLVSREQTKSTPPGHEPSLPISDSPGWTNWTLLQPAG